MIPVIILGLIVAGSALAALVAFAALVISVHATDRRLSLRQPPYGRIDALVRRVLGVYADRARCESETTKPSPSAARWPTPAPTPSCPTLATALNNLARVLSELGRDAESEDAKREAATIHQRL